MFLCCVENFLSCSLAKFCQKYTCKCPCIAQRSYNRKHNRNVFWAMKNQSLGLLFMHVMYMHTQKLLRAILSCSNTKDCYANVTCFLTSRGIDIVFHIAF